MSHDAILDVDELIAPIAGDDPVGADLRWEDEYADLEEARRADEDAGLDDVWSREKKVSDWPKIFKLGPQILRERSKDLQIAAWVAEAAAHLHGLVGVRDGLRLLLALQEAYWESIHPEHGDLELRRVVYEFLEHDRVMPVLVRMALATFVPGAPDYSFTFVDYEAARRTDLLAHAQFENEEQRAAALEGRLSGERFNAAVQATSREFYAETVETCQECIEAVEKINACIEQRWKGPQKPRLGKTEAKLREVLKLTRQWLDKKPAPAAPAAAEEEPASEGDDGWSSAEEPVEDGAESWAADEEVAEAEAPRPARRPAKRRAAGAPTTEEEARDQIAEAAHFLRNQDPDDPTSYLVLRALAAAALYRSGGLDSLQLPAPSSEVRERLFLGSRSEDEDGWLALVDEAEQAMGRPEGRGWLDLHWYAVRGLDSLGRGDAARACRSFLGACLRENADWIDSTLRDGTPCVSSTARNWLAEERLTGGAEPAPAPPPILYERSEPESSSSSIDEAVGNGPEDPWDVARAHARDGDVAQALAVMAKAVRQAGSGRERFQRELQRAELCIAVNRDALALPVLEILAARIDDQKLDQWEDPSFCARVLSALHRCLKGRDPARAAAIHHRLCQLDIGLALQLEDS